MDEIYWVYIIDASGKTLFTFENKIQGSLTANTSLLTHLIYSLQSISKDIRDYEVKGIEMGNNKFFITKEKLTNYLFILKTHRDANLEYINPILIEIKDKFTEKFTGHFSIDVEQKIKILKSFQEDVKKILSRESKEENLINLTENFFKDL